MTYILDAHPSERGWLAIRLLERILDGNETLLLAPAGRFATLGATLEKEGYPLSTHERQGIFILKVEPKPAGADTADTLGGADGTR